MSKKQQGQTLWLDPATLDTLRMIAMIRRQTMKDVVTSLIASYLIQNKEMAVMIDKLMELQATDPVLDLAKSSAGDSEGE